MPRWMTPPLALALASALVGCCPGSCDDCVEPVSAETSVAADVGGIAGLNGFVENRGQWPDEVLFFARRGGVEATVRRDALAFRPAPVRAGEPAALPLVFRLPGESAGRRVEGLDRLATKHHFLVGDCSASDAAGFGRVALRDVLPGVDVVLRADGGAFEYDLVLAPGASLAGFAVEVEGASALALRGAETLVLHTESGEVEQRIRAAWQGDGREPVACRFRALEPADGRLRFGFEAPEWSGELALVLDPTLVYLTYVGGASSENLREAEVGPSGALYLLAHTFGGMPVTGGALKTTPSGSDAWVGKLSPDGSTLEWATYLGGSGSDEAKDLCLAPDGSVVVLGTTWSADFPATAGALQTAKDGTFQSDLFVARLDPTGGALDWATFYGGPGFDLGWVCALYPDGDVLVGYEPDSAQPASTPGALDEAFDQGDQALFRLSADGSQRLWQTYFRASAIHDLLIDAQSVACFGGDILFDDAPLLTTPGALKEVMADGDVDGYVSRLSADGAQLVWSTYLGGDPDPGSTGDDHVVGLALDAAGAVYAAGYTSSDSFPVTAGAFQSALQGPIDGFVAKLLPEGTGLAWATYVGASGFPGSTTLQDVKVDAAGNAFVFGAANEPTFPVTPDAFQPLFIGPLPSSSDTLLCRLDAAAEGLLYATWIGSDGTDGAGELALDAGGGLWAAFQAGPGLATTAGAFQVSHAGSADLAAARFDFDALPWTILAGGLAGADAPSLVGLGALTTGSTTRLCVRGAPASGPAWIVAGLLQISLPFLGGTLVPFPTVVVPVSTDPSGAADFAFPWPTAPSGTAVFFQVWTPDALAPQGWSASNALKAVDPE